MNASRLLLVSLLLCDMMLSFGQGPVFPNAHAPGIPMNYQTITSYVTSTSTFYSYLYPTTSTRFSTATVTTDRLTQIGSDGPYVMITGTWNVFVEGILEFNVTIMNLMEYHIQQGIIQFGVVGLKIRRDDIELRFMEIPRRETILVKLLIGLPGINPGAKVSLLSVAISLGQEERVISTMPIETNTRNQTVTETHRRSIVQTVAYTLEESFPAGNVGTIAGLMLVAVALVVAFFFTRMRRRPARRLAEAKKPRYRIDLGRSYVVEGGVDTAYEIFREGLLSGMNGLCITRVIPKRVRTQYELYETPVVWLTDETIEGQPTVSNLNDLSILISDHVEKKERLIIIIDGVEYLVSRFGFDSVYQFLQTKRSQIERTNNVLIVTLFKEALDPKEVKLLERELQPLEKQGTEA